MAWELLTEVFGLDGDRLWVTVHESDDEAEQIWIDKVGVRPERIQRMGDEDNFWAMGDTGPVRPRLGDLLRQGRGLRRTTAAPSTAASDRFVEIWNLVFMQFNRDADGVARPTCRARTSTPAPASSGSCPSSRGTIRCSTPTCSCRSSTRRPPSSAPPTGPTSATDVALRVLADHGRAFSMLVADGVLPANEGRGLRAAPRRAPRRPGRPPRSASTSPSAPTLVAGGHRRPGRGLPRAARRSTI